MLVVFPLKLLLSVILFISFLPQVFAVEWDDFTNNFATDLAPLITLFGEQVTKQYLSESLTIWDNIVFAMAPLGLLTAVVSVIRVRGSASLRAFIGRAQESPGVTEVEILSSTSATTAELFNEAGIARVFGKPQILEVVVVPSESDPTSLKMDFLWKEEDCDGAWVATRAGGRSKYRFAYYQFFQSRAKDHSPNLSLNLGITKISPIFTYACAAIGMLLQSGVLIFAALTTYYYPDSFSVREEPGPTPTETKTFPADDYAFPMTFSGTILVCFGMFMCAYLIDKSTFEYYWVKDPQIKSRLYWVQPGGQKIGDQIFPSYITGSDITEYIFSEKNTTWNELKASHLAIALVASILGFILQFVGLRALHPSVTLTQIGVTLLMSVLRAMLRSKRIDKSSNMAAAYSEEEEHDTSGKNWAWKPDLLHGHELDLFALQLYDLDMLFITGAEPSELSTQETKERPRSGAVTNPVEARVRLAELTPWPDLKVRKVAMALQATIESVLEIIDGGPISTDGVYGWSAKFNTVKRGIARPVALSGNGPFPDCENQCGPKTTKEGLFELLLRKGADGVSWKTERSDLEALLGLWLISIRQRDGRDDLTSYTRVLATMEESPENNPDDMADQDIWHKVWIQRRYDLKSGKVRWDNELHTLGQPSPNTYTARNFYDTWGWSQPVFGCYGLKGRSGQFHDLVYHTVEVEVKETTTIQMCAQDLFIHFLDTLFSKIDNIGGETSTRATVDGNYLLVNSKVEAIADRFERSGLGSREDAYMCIFPVLYKRGKMPKIDQTLPEAISQSNIYKRDGNWMEALRLLQWIVTSDAGVNRAKAEAALGELSYKALCTSDDDVKELGRICICNMLLFNPNSETAKSYGWIALQEAKKQGLEEEAKVLRFAGAKDDVVQGFTESLRAVDWAEKNNLTALIYLIGKGGCDLNERNESGRAALHWAVNNRNVEMINLLLSHKVQVMTEDNDGFKPSDIAAKLGFEDILDIFHQYQPDSIGHPSSHTSKMTALMHAAENGHRNCVLRILDIRPRSVNNRNAHGNTALSIAANKGHGAIVRLLLYSGVNIQSQNISGDTALHLAAEQGDHSIIDALVRAGADVNIEDMYRMTPLHRAIDSGSLQAVEILLKHIHVFKINQPIEKDGLTALDNAVLNGYEDIVKLLLNKGAIVISSLSQPYHQIEFHLKYYYDPKVPGGKDLRSAISHAAILENINIFKMLVEHVEHEIPDRAFWVFIVDAAGRTVLHQAVEFRRYEIVRMILASIERDPDPESSLKAGAQDKRGMTPLHSILHFSNDAEEDKVLEFLNAVKYDINLKDNTEKTPLHYAASRGFESVVSKLLQRGALIDDADYFGQTALYKAADHNQISIVILLLEAGAKVDIRVGTGKTTLEWAIETIEIPEDDPSLRNTIEKIQDAILDAHEQRTGKREKRGLVRVNISEA